MTNYHIVLQKENKWMEGKTGKDAGAYSGGGAKEALVPTQNFVGKYCPLLDFIEWYIVFLFAEALLL